MDDLHDDDPMTWTGPQYAAVPVMATKLDAMRADLDLCLGYLRRVLDGMTVQELAALGDVVEEVEARWGLGEVQC